MVAPAVASQLGRIARAVEMVVKALRRGGRVFYVGAGTSGRLGVVDAAECPPTFGTPPTMFQGIIAGGPRAVFRAQENSEDRFAEARRVVARRVTARDVVVGLAACKRTPFVMAALGEARRRGARTIYVTCNPRPLVPAPRSPGRAQGLADVVIVVDVGPEPIMGSTRMKSGTAEKLVLNMISTVAMIKLGKVYGNLMVDLRATSEKLRQRSVRIIMLATACGRAEARRLLRRAQGSVKVAIVMNLAGVDREGALSLLARSDGSVKRTLALAAQPKTSPPRKPKTGRQPAGHAGRHPARA